MQIDREKLNRTQWWEDEYGNIVSEDVAKELDHATFHSRFPLQISEDVYVYKWVPQTLWQKHLCLIKPLRKWLEKKHANEKAFNCFFTGNTHIGYGNEDIIIAMVNSGDYTLSEALILYSQSCERCMNVLANKYLGEKEGYPEYSEEWYKCRTVCDWCREETDDKKSI